MRHIIALGALLLLSCRIQSPPDDDAAVPADGSRPQFDGAGPLADEDGVWGFADLHTHPAGHLSLAGLSDGTGGGALGHSRQVDHVARCDSRPGAV